MAMAQVIAVFCLMVVYVFALTLRQITLIAAWLRPVGAGVFVAGLGY
jgi:hypothetical protein